VCRFVQYENFLYTASWDSTAKQWNSETGESLQTFPSEPGRQVISIAITPDGQFLFTGTTQLDVSITQWRISDVTKVKIFKGSAV
jgi:WD40 repeat protein